MPLPQLSPDGVCITDSPIFLNTSAGRVHFALRELPGWAEDNYRCTALVAQVAGEGEYVLMEIMRPREDRRGSDADSWVCNPNDIVWASLGLRGPQVD